MAEAEVSHDTDWFSTENLPLACLVADSAKWRERLKDTCGHVDQENARARLFRDFDDLAGGRSGHERQVERAAAERDPGALAIGGREHLD